MFLKRWLIVATPLLLVGLLFFALAVPAQASDVRNGDALVIGAGETIDDDLLLFGNRITMDGNVTGDLIVFGAEVVINGDVGGSVILASQTAHINGTVGGSVYSGVMTLVLDEGANIGRNLYVGAFGLETAEGSMVGRDINAGVYQVVHNGQVEGDLVVAASAVQVNGGVGGDVRGEVSAADQGMTARPPFLPGMPADVEVLEPGLDIDSGTVGGSIAVQEVTAEAVAAETGIFGLPLWLTTRIGEFIALLIVGALFIWLLPRFLPEVSDKLQQQPLPSLGWGLLISLIVVPLGLFVGLILMIILAVIANVLTLGELTGSVITLGLAALFFALVAFVFIATTVSQLLVSFLIGRAIWTRLSTGTGGRWTGLGSIALGAVIYEVLRAIPVLGFILAVVVMFFGVGAIYLYLRDRRAAVVVVEKTPKVQVVG